MEPALQHQVKVVLLSLVARLHREQSQGVLQSTVDVPEAIVSHYSDLRNLLKLEDLMLKIREALKKITTFFVTNVTNLGGGLETHLSQKITMSQNPFLAI